MGASPDDPKYENKESGSLDEATTSAQGNRDLEPARPLEITSHGSRGNSPSHLVADGFTLSACLHAVERVPAEGRGKAAQFIPIRFVFTNKLTHQARDARGIRNRKGKEANLLPHMQTASSGQGMGG